MGGEAGAGNSTGKDAENQKSDDAKGGETGDDVQSEGLSEEDSQDEDAEQTADDASNEGAISPVAEDATEYTLINSADDLSHYLQNDKKAGKYRLNLDIEYASDITLGQGETTIDLNGHKIKHSGVESGKSPNMSMFNVPEGATLTIEDLQQAADNKFEQGGDKNGNLAKLDYDGTTPSKLTYYVTESTSSDTATTETLFKHEVAIKGAIVGTTAHSTMRLINVCGGTFNLQSGVLTTNQDANVRHLIYADNGSTVNMSGGYVCGASMGRDGAGAGIHVEGSTLDEGSTLVISGGVIAGNYAPSGGGVYARNSTVNMVDGIISGNGTNDYQSGYGAGICAENSSVTITRGYITNNNYQFYREWEGNTNHLGNGCHGGGGIAAFNGGSLTIAGGYITGNYSAEAGGGVYAGAWNSALSLFTFSGGTIASNVAQNSEGGGIRISAPTESVFNVPIGTKAYITNNKTNTDNDWGGGGVFVQGGDGGGVQPASLKIYNALITKNLAWGFGGGFAACPTGKTAITDTNGIAVFGNTDKDGEHRSKGSHSKTADADDKKGGQITDSFKTAGHQDLFLIRDSTNNPESLPYIAAVTGQMLGGGAANWKGTIDKTPTSIGKYEGAQARYMIGLRSDSSVDDQNVAKGLASLYITGNESNVHGGGIMTNGDVIAGSTTLVSVYPKMKLNGTKALTGRKLSAGEFKFQLLKQGASGAPSFGTDGTLQLNGCTKVGDWVTNDGDGNFAFNLGEVYADTGLVYYLVEVPGTDKDVIYDKTIYKIDPTVTEDKTRTHEVLGIKYTYYTVSNVKITTIAANGTESESKVTPNIEDDVASVNLSTSSKTFTNYTSNGSWIPKATKVVKGGEMKEFTLQLAKDSRFSDECIIGTAVTSGPAKTQTLSFRGASGKEIELKYSLSDITANPDTAGDSTGRGASKTFYYYVCEEDESSTYPHYKFDQSVYRFKVVATDNTKGGIDCAVTYQKGTVGSDGNWKADVGAEELNLTDTSTPTFTNTYSTSLPLSGMSGVTLTYIAGAAVLCAAAAWMHIRRKANAKGGKRRE